MSKYSLINDKMDTYSKHDYDLYYRCAVDVRKYIEGKDAKD